MSRSEKELPTFGAYKSKVPLYTCDDANFLS